MALCSALLPTIKILGGEVSTNAVLVLLLQIIECPGSLDKHCMGHWWPMPILEIHHSITGWNSCTPNKALMNNCSTTAIY